jgi:hypothetical protein
VNAQDFAFWLHGFVELTQGQTPNPAQWKSICEHLDLVFKKVTPPVGDTSTVKVNVDTKDATKAVDDLKKAYEDLAKKAKEVHIPSWPDWRWDPTHQPYWLQTYPGFPPGTIVCSTGQMSVAGGEPTFC